MKIGELFIALGFKVEGKEKVDETERTIEKTALKAAKLTLAVNAVNTALLAMVITAGRAGQVLKNFARETGLDPAELQRWQHLGVVTGTTAEEVQRAFENLQKTRANFALGEPSDVGVWQLLGVDPRQDPAAMMTQLRASIKKLDPAIAHELLSRVGLGGLTPMLRATDAEFKKWSRDFILSRDQIERLAKFNAAWGSLKMSVSAVKNIFAAALAPALTVLAHVLEWIASKLAAFVDWLNKGSIVATVVRWGIVAVTFALLALGVALAVVTAALGALTVAMIAFDVAAWASGIPEVILTITGLVALIASIVAGLVLLVDDIITSISGGKAVTRRLGEWLASFKAIELVIRGIWWVWDRFVSALRWGIDSVKKNAASIGVNLAGAFTFGPGAFGAIKFIAQHWEGLIAIVRQTGDYLLAPFRALSALWDKIVDKARVIRDVLGVFSSVGFGAFSIMSPEKVADRAAEPARKAANSVTINQSNDVDVHVSGAKSPEATGKAVSKSFKDEIAGAAYQLPVPNF